MVGCHQCVVCVWGGGVGASVCEVGWWVWWWWGVGSADSGRERGRLMVCWTAAATCHLLLRAPLQCPAPGCAGASRAGPAPAAAAAAQRSRSEGCFTWAVRSLHTVTCQFSLTHVVCHVHIPHTPSVMRLMCPCAHHSTTGNSAAACVFAAPSAHPWHSTCVRTPLASGRHRQALRPAVCLGVRPCVVGMSLGTDSSPSSACLSLCCAVMCCAVRCCLSRFLSLCDSVTAPETTKKHAHVQSLVRIPDTLLMSMEFLTLYTPSGKE